MKEYSLPSLGSFLYFIGSGHRAKIQCKKIVMHFKIDNWKSVININLHFCAQIGEANTNENIFVCIFTENQLKLLEQIYLNFVNPPECWSMTETETLSMEINPNIYGYHSIKGTFNVILVTFAIFFFTMYSTYSSYSCIFLSHLFCHLYN